MRRKSSLPLLTYLGLALLSSSSYGQGINDFGNGSFTGQLVTTNTTDSTADGIGALQVTGGGWFGKTLRTDGNLISPTYRTLESFSASTSAVDNSADIARALASGDPIFIDGWFHITNPVVVNACPTVIGQGPDLSGIYSDAAGANIQITCPLTLTNAVSGLVHLERFGIVTTVAQPSATALTVHMGSQQGNTTAQPTARIRDLQISGDDDGATHYWASGMLLTNAEDFDVTGNWIQGNPLTVAPPYPAGSYGIKATTDANTGSTVGTLARNYLQDWDKGVWVAENGRPSIEGLVFRDNVLVTDNHGFYIDGSSETTYYPPSFVFENNQTAVNDESIWANHVAQLFITNNTLYCQIPSCNGIVEINDITTSANHNVLDAGQASATAAAPSGNTLNLQAANAAVAVGQYVYDATHPTAVAAGTTVSSVSGTAIGLSGSAAGVSSGDTIYFDSGTAIALSGTQVHEELDNQIGSYGIGISTDATSYNGGVRGGLSNAMVQTSINPASLTSQLSLTGGGGGNGWTLTNGLNVASGNLTASAGNISVDGTNSLTSLDGSFLLGGDSNGDLVLGKGGASVPYLNFDSAHTGASYDARIQSLGANQLGIYLAGGATTALTLSTSAVIAGLPTQLKAYLVSTLPTCNLTIQGAMAAIADFSGTPAYNGVLTGGGSTWLPVFCNGTSWTAH